jgi:hypothetical protein
MHNENSTADKKEVSLDTLETIYKLAHSGFSPEDISSTLKLSIETIQEIIANDPMLRARMVQSIKEKSAEYRCAKSNRLMISPVMASDDNFYEQSILENDPSLSIDQFLPSKKLKAKIADFSIESLKVLQRSLQQKLPQEDILELTAECLSVLSPDAGMETTLRVLGTVEGETVKRLLRKLRGLVPEDMLLSLMSQLVRELPSHAFCLAALIILQPRSEIALEKAFRCFAELLTHVTLDAGVINLAEEVSERLSSSQLSQLNEALLACPREGGDSLDGLRLKEAYALLREGKVEAAICLVNTMRISPRLENEVLRFFDEAGLSSGKVPILEQKLSAKLEEISRDSPSVAETLSIIHQLLNAEIHSRRSEATSQSLITLKAEVLNETLAKLEQPTSHAFIAQEARIQRLEEQTSRKEADCQETLSSLRSKVEALTEELVKAVQAASQTQTAQDARFQRLEGKLSKAEAATQECLISLRAELRVLDELAAKSGENLIKAGQAATQTQLAQDAQLERLEEQAQRKEAECKETLSNLRTKVEVLTEELIRVGQAASQTKNAQEATLRSIEESSQKSETVAQQALTSLRDKVEALTGVHLKAGEEVKSVKRAHDIQIQGLDEKFNKAEAATQQTLNILRGAVEAMRVDLGQAWSQCEQAQEPMLNATSEKTPAVLAHTLDSYSTSPPSTTEETKESEPPKPQHTPTFLYSLKANTNQLERVNLLTGEESKHEVSHYLFNDGCRWSKLPGGSLLITGGGSRDAVSDVVRLDVGTFAVSPQPPMHTPRSDHAAVYHSQYVYVLGGYSNPRCLSECERYSCAESRWEVLPALPVPGGAMSGVEVEYSVYALGGYGGRVNLDTVQKLNLDSLTWLLMRLKLPQAASCFPCFKKDTEVYLVIATTLYSFTPFQVKAVKTLDRDIKCFSSYYSRGTLYYEKGRVISSISFN